MRLFRIRQGKLQTFLDWGQYLQHSMEAIETLKEEHVKFEAFYYFKIGDDYYTIGVTDNPNPLPATERELNKQHKLVLKECLEIVGNVNQVYSLQSKA